MPKSLKFWAKVDGSAGGRGWKQESFDTCMRPSRNKTKNRKMLAGSWCQAGCEKYTTESWRKLINTTDMEVPLVIPHLRVAPRVLYTWLWHAFGVLWRVIWCLEIWISHSQGCSYGISASGWPCLLCSTFFDRYCLHVSERGSSLQLGYGRLHLRGLFLLLLNQGHCAHHNV